MCENCQSTFCEECSSPKESIMKCLKSISFANARINSTCVYNEIFPLEIDAKDFEDIEEFSNIIFHNSKQIMKCLSHIEEIPPDD